METRAFFGHHKCASTYMKMIIRQISHLIGLSLHTEILSRKLPLGYERFPEQAQRIKNAYNRILNSNFHFLFHGNADNSVVETLSERGAFKAVHLIRDPRDLLVSAYFWHQSEKVLENIGLNYWITDRYNQLRKAGNKEAGLLLELDFCSCYFKTFEEWDFHTSNILEIRFEDLASDPISVFTNIFSFLEFPVIKQLHLTKKSNSGLLKIQPPFTEDMAKPKILLSRLLKANSYQIVSEGRKPGEEKPGDKYRNGKSGDWRVHFTPRVIDAFKNQYGELLIKLGYETSNDWSN
jgi:hypothetical protein